MFIPEEEFHSPQQHLHQQHHQGLEEDAQAADAGEKKKSFSTFGKDCQSEEESGDTCTSSLLSEMSSVFQRLLPTSLDAYTECNEMDRSDRKSVV